MGNARWRNFNSAFRETDLWVAVEKEKYTIDIERFTLSRIKFYRASLDRHIREYPLFRDSLVPVPLPSGQPAIISSMYMASAQSGTGPMSAVAGAMAEFICTDLIEAFGLKEVVSENGGDLFMQLSAPATISVYAGNSPLSERIGLYVKPEDTPVSLCCSSGTTGHSLSFGVADACMIACRSGALADAYATAFCNEVKNKEMVQEVTEHALGISDIISVVIIKDDTVGIGGTLEIKIRD